MSDWLPQARQAPETTVPACPGWTLSDLYAHLSDVHRNVIQTLATAGTDRRPEPRGQNSEQHHSDPFDGFLESSRDLFKALTATDPGLACWGFGPPPRLAAFWFRRQNMEHLVHAEDLAQSLRSQEPAMAKEAHLSNETALDGVSELLDMLVPQRIRSGTVEQPAAALRFEAAGQSWIVGAGEVVASLTTDPVTMLLGLWRRRPLLSLAITTGDREVLGAFLQSKIVP
nr:maleylpyruvate isomerase family mycothiol-dependent enzyme [Psychromicrobium silvestre]